MNPNQNQNNNLFIKLLETARILPPVDLVGNVFDARSNFQQSQNLQDQAQKNKEIIGNLELQSDRLSNQGKREEALSGYSTIESLLQGQSGQEYINANKAKVIQNDTIKNALLTMLLAATAQKLGGPLTKRQYTKGPYLPSGLAKMLGWW